MTEHRLDIAAVGDAMVTKRLSEIDDERFRELRELLVDADASIANLEGPLHDYEPYPVARKTTHFRSPEWAADELVWMGFDLLSATNNHIGDYAQPGMTATMAALEERELPYAGIGENRARARSPSYVETPNGRVALLAASTTFVPGTQSAHQRSEVRGRPGIATLRLRPRYVVTDEQFEALRDLHDAFGFDELIDDRGEYVESVDRDDALAFLDVGAGTAGNELYFERGDETRIYYEADPRDVAEIYEEIERAERNADRVVFSLHSHEGADGTYNDDSVPEAVESFARGCVDRGADLFVCHGAHRLRGIEIYGGAPLFYGLGNFVLQFNDVPFFPAEEYESRGLGADDHPVDIQRILGDVVERDENKRSVVPICEFDADGLTEVRLHPIELGYDRNAANMGVARLADERVGDAILDRLDTLSGPYDVRVRTENGVGIVEP